MDKSFFTKYFDLLSKTMNQVQHSDFENAADQIKSASSQGKKVILVGNGGSAAMASHVTVDLTKAAGIRAINFNEADFLTCLANDYGYDHWVEKALEFYADEGDVLILISSSGRSPNIINAAQQAKKIGLTVITLSGFQKENPLKKMGDINFWVDSKGYNIIEMTHHIWLVALVDSIIGKIEYSA